MTTPENVTRWSNPLTGATELPETPGDLLPAAIAYWEDVLLYWRSKRPRKLEEKRVKSDRVATATERLHRFRSSRERFAFHPKNFTRDNRLTLQLATDDLAPVMSAPMRSAA